MKNTKGEILIIAAMAVMMVGMMGLMFFGGMGMMGKGHDDDKEHTKKEHQHDPVTDKNNRIEDHLEEDEKT